MNPRKAKRKAFTLVELLMALVVIGVLSAAVMALITGAAKTYSYLYTQTGADSQAEIAYRRIMHNLRTASALTAPANTSASSTLTTVTQPDPNNANATYTVMYTLSGSNLTESDSRYNGAGNTPNVIATNVTAFTVQRNMTSPISVTVTLTIGTNPPVTRSASIYCRNL